MEKESLSDVFWTVFRGVIFCILGCLLFASGWYNIIHHGASHVASTITGGLIFLCLGLFAFIIGAFLLYGVLTGKFPLYKTPDELDPDSKRAWFTVFMAAMLFLGISGLLTIVWGIMYMVDANGKKSEILNMMLVMFVGLLMFGLPVGLFVSIAPSIQSSPTQTGAEDQTSLLQTLKLRSSLFSF